MHKHLLAQITNPALPASLGQGAYTVGGSVIGMLISNIIGALFLVAFILTLFFLLMGGIQWVTSGGDKGRLEEARNKITNAILGLIIVGAIWAIMTLVGLFFGISFLHLPFPSFPSTLNTNVNNQNAQNATDQINDNPSGVNGGNPFNPIPK